MIMSLITAAFVGLVYFGSGLLVVKVGGVITSLSFVLIGFIGWGVLLAMASITDSLIDIRNNLMD